MEIIRTGVQVSTPPQKLNKMEELKDITLKVNLPMIPVIKDEFTYLNHLSLVQNVTNMLADTFDGQASKSSHHRVIELWESVEDVITFDSILKERLDYILTNFPFIEQIQLPKEEIDWTQA